MKYELYVGVVLVMVVLPDEKEKPAQYFSTLCKVKKTQHLSSCTGSQVRRTCVHQMTLSILY